MVGGRGSLPHLVGDRPVRKFGERGWEVADADHAGP